VDASNQCVVKASTRGDMTTWTMYCLGCVSDITDKATNGRSLQGATAKNVIAVWKSLIDAEYIGPEIDSDSLISAGGDPAHAGKMCRTCYILHMSDIQFYNCQ